MTTDELTVTSFLIEYPVPVYLVLVTTAVHLLCFELGKKKEKMDLNWSLNRSTGTTYQIGTFVMPIMKTDWGKRMNENVLFSNLNSLLVRRQPVRS